MSELTKRVANAPSTDVFSSPESFENAQRMAMMLSKTQFVPQQFQGETGVGNCMVALEMAFRTGQSPVFVMQNLDIIHGRPAWKSTFVLGVIKSCGRFKNVREVYEGTPGTDNHGARIHADRVSDGEHVIGPLVTIAMAKKEGWFTKNGSKWQTMPEMMLVYRAASFFGRIHISDILLGMHSADEASDFAPQTEDHPTNIVDDAKEAFKQKPKKTPVPQQQNTDPDF